MTPLYRLQLYRRRGRTWPRYYTRCWHIHFDRIVRRVAELLEVLDG
jgi:hypothetical protein